MSAPVPRFLDAGAAAKKDQDDGKVARAGDRDSDRDALPLTAKQRRAPLEMAADEIARLAASDAVRHALADSGLTLREIHARTGIEPTVISRAATGANKEGPRLTTLAIIALALGKTLTVSIE